MNVNDYTISKVGGDDDFFELEVQKDGVVVTTGKFDVNASVCSLVPVPAIDEDEFELVQAIEQGTITIEL